MNIEQLHLAQGCLTDNIYVGILEPNGTYWKEKKDVTNDFLAAVISRWKGSTEEITCPDTSIYKITVEEIRGPAQEVPSQQT